MKQETTLSRTSLLERAEAIHAAAEERTGIPKSVFVMGVQHELSAMEYKSFAVLQKEERYKDFLDALPNSLKADAQAKERALFIVAAMLEESEQALEAIPDTKAYRHLYDKTAHTAEMKKMFGQLSAARLDLLNYKAKKTSFTQEAAIYKYAAAERKLLKNEVLRRTGNSPAFRFVEHDLQHDILLATLKPLGETQAEYTSIVNTIDRFAREKGINDLLRPAGDVVGKKGILEKIEQKLRGKPHNIGKAVLEKLNLQACFDDRFFKVDDNSLSMEVREITEVVDTFAPLLKNTSGNPRKIADAIAKDIYARAKFDRKSSVTADIESRFGKTPEDRYHSENNKDGLIVAGIGLGISTLSGLLGASAKLDSTPVIPRPDETAEEITAREKKNKQRAMGKIVFASVTSIIGTAILFDGLLFGGKHTMQLWNRMRGRGGPGGSAPSF